MGIAGCIGGPLFNLLLGAGISLIRTIVSMYIYYLMS
jgi:Ca2+/Na+ antiporter